MDAESKIGPHSRSYVRFVLPICRFIGWLLFTVLGPLRVRGRYRVPKTGGVLILSNHIADVDPVVVQMACKRPIHFMAKSELFEMPVLSKVIKVFKAFPIKRGEPDRGAMRRAVALLQMGEVVCIFPEGELSETGELRPLKAGMALIVRMAAGCPVICCGVRGTNRVMPYGTTIPRPGWRRIPVEWGEVRTFAKDTETEEIVAWADGQLRELTGQEIY